MKDNIEYVKLDIDDIIEIILEHFQEQFENSEYAKGIILGSPDNELRFIGAFGNQNNHELAHINLEEIEKNMDYTGDHSFLKNNPDFFIK